jgi:hypothetical protein
VPRDPRSRPGPRVAAKRELIVETPSERSPSRVPGRQGGGRRGRARHLEGPVFQHFGSKAGLFLAAYRRAVETLSAWLDAPDDVRAEGFWSVVVYWLERTEHLVRENWARIG